MRHRQKDKAAQVYTRPNVPRSPPEPAVEQRQITVMACGIVIARDHEDDRPIDLEALDQIERTRLKLCERIAREEGGTPVRPQSSRLFVVFGYPHARENDARRAIQTARRIALEVGTEVDGGSRIRA